MVDRASRRVVHERRSRVLPGRSALGRGSAGPVDGEPLVSAGRRTGRRRHEIPEDARTGTPRRPDSPKALGASGRAAESRWCAAARASLASILHTVIPLPRRSSFRGRCRRCPVAHTLPTSRASRVYRIRRRGGYVSRQVPAGGHGLPRLGRARLLLRRGRSGLGGGVRHAGRALSDAVSRRMAQMGAGSPKPGSILARRRPGSSHVDMRGLERSSLLPLRAVRFGGRFR